MNLSKINETLYIGTTPKAKDYDLLISLGIELVINMRFGIPPVRELFLPPLKSLWLPTIDSPLFPIPIIALEKGAEEALKVTGKGGVVLAHCTKGRHRGVAMGACILIAQGMPVDQVMKLIKEKRAVADPYAWYIRRRIVKFERIWGEKDHGDSHGEA
jgi:protein tyrosine phosphatase (PTP) superfamily phosphohydrolase (DUF442 family)